MHDDKSDQAIAPVSARRQFGLTRLLGPAATVAVLLAGVFCAHHPMLLSGFRQIQTDAGDTRFNHYVLEHSFRYLRGDELHQRLWDPPFFYPEKNVLAFSDNLLTVAPWYWMYRAAGLELNVSFCLWMMTLTALNFVAAWAFLRYGYRFGAGASTIGSFIISFGNSRMIQMGHQQLQPQFFTFLALLGLMKLFGERELPVASRRVWWGVIAACGVAQIYASYYTGYFLFLALLFGGAALLRKADGRGRLRAAWTRDKRWLAGCAVAGFIALIPWIQHYGSAMKSLGGRGPGSFRQGFPRLASYLHMGESNWLYGWTSSWSIFQGVPYGGEFAIGLGCVTTGVTAWYLWSSRQTRSARMIAAIIGIALVLFTRTDSFCPFGNILYYTLPGAQGIRAMVRLGLMLLIPAGIAVAYLVESGATVRRRSLAMAIALVCCLEQMGNRWSFDAAARAERVAALQRTIPEGSNAVFFGKRDGSQIPAFEQIDAMWASMLSGVPTVNGYSGNWPKDYPSPLFELQDAKDGPTVEGALNQWMESQRNSAASKVEFVGAPEAIAEVPAEAMLR